MSHAGRFTGLRAPRPCIETEKPTSSTLVMRKIISGAFVLLFQSVTRDLEGGNRARLSSPGKARLQSWEVMAAILGSASQD